MGVKEAQKSNFLSHGNQLLGNFVGDCTSVAMATKVVRTVRLDAANLVKMVCA